MGDAVAGVICADELPLGPLAGRAIASLTTEQLREVRAGYLPLCNACAKSNPRLSDDLRLAIARIDREGISRKQPQAPR